VLKVEKNKCVDATSKLHSLAFYLSSSPPLPIPESPVGVATLRCFCPFPSLPLEVHPLNTAKWSGEHCKLPRDLGHIPYGNWIWCIL